MKLGKDTGSLINHISASISKVLQIGMGVSILRYTDRQAGTIIEINKSGKTIVVQYDKVKNLGTYEDPKYQYSTDSEGIRDTFKLRKDGTWKSKSGDGLRIGVRDHYQDPSF